MRKKMLIAGVLIFISSILYGQEKISLDKIDPNSQFIFNDFINLPECDLNGIMLNNRDQIQMPINAIFHIVGKTKKDEYIIQFLRWKWNKENNVKNFRFVYKEIGNQSFVRKEIEQKRLNLSNGRILLIDSNKEPNDSNLSKDQTIDITDRYFLIPKNDLVLKGLTYTPIQRWEFVFGTITYVARIRPSTGRFASNWSTDLNLGVAYGVKRNFGRNWGVAALGGLSISKIKIDSLSTNPSISHTIEKVSLSPTLNFLVNYKNFYIGLGIGFDWINLDTEESKQWVYNKKSFYAIGIGVNLFNSSKESSPKATNGN